MGFETTTKVIDFPEFPVPCKVSIFPGKIKD